MAARMSGRFKLSSLAAILLIAIAATWLWTLYLHSSLLPDFSSDRRNSPGASSSPLSPLPQPPSLPPSLAIPLAPEDSAKIEEIRGDKEAKLHTEGQEMVKSTRSHAGQAEGEGGGGGGKVRGGGGEGGKEGGGEGSKAATADGSKGEGGRKAFAKDTAIVVLSCQRVEYLSQTLESLMSLEGIEDYTVILSQDGNHGGVEALSESYVRKSNGMMRHVHNTMRQNHLDKGDQASVHYIADHYKFVLSQVFDQQPPFKRAILVEEDMILAKDFLLLFESAGPLLDEDETLMCVSSWNDNGYKGMDLSPDRLFRSGFFPGLGWMLRKEMWEELRFKWPKSHWDHWTRVDAQSKGRDCIVPEISRNHNIGANGATVNSGSFASRLSNVAFAGEGVTTFGDLSYLLRPKYLEYVQGLLKLSTPLPFHKALTSGGGFSSPGSIVRVGFPREEWPAIAEKAGLYVSMWPRGHFEQVVIVKKGGSTLLLFDVRRSMLAPEGEAEKPKSPITKLAGNQGESCDSVCRGRNLRCERRWFDLVNSCHDLQAAFPCESCSYEVGKDIPVFVSDRSHPNGGVCLVTDATTTCEASHRSTSRMCPCV